MPRKSSQPPGDPMIPVTIYIPRSMHGLCKSERINVSGTASRGLRKELAAMGFLE